MFYGACCHVCFVAGVGTMMIMMFFGMSRSFGVLHAPWSYLANALLLVQFPLLHSMLLSRRGRAVLGRLAPQGLGGRLATTTYALIASVQVGLLFALWSPSGTVWWRASGHETAMTARKGMAWRTSLSICRKTDRAAFIQRAGGAAARFRQARRRRWSAANSPLSACEPELERHVNTRVGVYRAILTRCTRM